jgi:cytochrome c-type biogenesis protein CcmH
MTLFVLLVAALTAAVVVLVALPLVRAGTAEPPSRWAALSVTALLVFGGSLLYLTWSNWKWHAATEADSPQTMVARLSRQLEKDPKNLDGWLLLGRSYLVLQEYPLALRAFERADRMSEGKNAEALIGEAEALTLTDESELAGRAGKLIERALVLTPDSGQALFFGAAAASHRGDLPLARERYARLLSMNPPAAVRPLIEQQVSALDEQIARGAGAGPVPAAGPASTDAAVRVNVSLGARLAAGPPAPLFVFVRKPGEGGPPLAAKRLEGHFPQSVTLTPADAMIPGRTFSAGQEVQVVARIARSGTAVGAKGDPYGQISYRVGKDAVVNLVIDQLTP